MKQNMMILGFAALFILAACSSEETVTIKSTGGIVSSSDQGSGNVVEVTFEAWRWDFSPKEIRVKEGDTVRITATSRDTTHGFFIPEFGFNMEIFPDVSNTGEFVATTKGTYAFACSVFCGDGHGIHQGVLIVG